jgi:fido (protein-threonine AMPylation protein)
MNLEQFRVEEGVFPSIRTRRQYDRLVRDGFERTSHIYSGKAILSPTLTDFLDAHRQIFEQVSDQAGQVRDAGCSVQIYDSFVHSDVEEEFELLGQQLAAMTARASTVQDSVVIVAFTHARIVATQPAVFGNKRAAMCLSISQIRALFPFVATLHVFKHDEYYKALTAALVDGSLELLNAVFGQILGISGIVNTAPFRTGLHAHAGRRKQLARFESRNPAASGSRSPVLVGQ